MTEIPNRTPFCSVQANSSLPQLIILLFLWCLKHFLWRKFLSSAIDCIHEYIKLVIAPIMTWSELVAKSLHKQIYDFVSESMGAFSGYHTAMMTSWHEKAYRITGPLWGESAGFRSVTWGFGALFDVIRNKPFNKQSRYRWFETPTGSYAKCWDFFNSNSPKAICQTQPY